MGTPGSRCRLTDGRPQRAAGKAGIFISLEEGWI